MIGINSNPKKQTLFLENSVNNHSFNTVEEKFKLVYQIILKRKNSGGAEISYENFNYQEALVELEGIMNEIDKVEIQNKNIDLYKTNLKYIFELVHDNSFILILENLNIFSFEEAKFIYTIFKILKTFSKLEKYKNFHEFLYSNMNQIVSYLLNNLNSESKDFVIIIVSKCLRKLSQESKYLEIILTWENFNFIYSKTRSHKFILLQECFSTISYFFESPKVDNEIVIKFLESKEKEFSQATNFMLGYSGDTRKIDKECIEDDFYLLKRETLILLEKILMNLIYEKFTLSYTNRVENLKSIMMQLNNKCLKIVYQAVDILYYFFVDVELKSRGIKLLLHNNKKKFYEFFEKHENFFLEDSDMSYKKCFILYELERLENYLEDA